jgi:hypothetical protein
MESLHLNKIDSQQWYISILIILGILVVVIIVTRMDSKKHKKAAGDTKVYEIDKNSSQLEKASEGALEKATEQMTRAYKSNFESRLKENMNRLDNSFNTNADKITNEFNNSLTNFQNQTQEIIGISRNKIESYYKDMETKANESVALRKKEAIEAVDKNINKILMTYLNNSLEGSIDLNDQQEYILDKLEKNKSTISKDINNA